MFDRKKGNRFSRKKEKHFRHQQLYSYKLYSTFSREKFRKVHTNIKPTQMLLMIIKLPHFLG